MPKEPNQFNYSGPYYEYFGKLFRREFPAYEIDEKTVPNPHYRYAPNPRNPFGSSPESLKNGGSLTRGFFEFDPARVSSNYRYLPEGCTEPYIYLKARGATGNKKYYPGNTYVAYGDENDNYYNPESYQIISAGLDDDWGQKGNVEVAEGNISAATADNIVNFGKKTVKDLLD